MSKFDSNKSPALEAMQELQKSSAFAAAMKLQESSAFAAALKMETSGAFEVAKEIKSALELAKMPMSGVATAIAEYHNMIAPISESIKQFNIAYSPIIEATKTFKSICMKDLIVGLQASMPAINAIKSIDFVGYANIIDALPKHNFIKDIAVNGFSIEEAEKLFEDGEISQEDINEEFADIIEKKKFSPSEKWNEIQKSKWFLAINLLITILMFIGNPLIEYTGDKVRDAIGITQFIEDYDLYSIIDSFFEQFEDDKEIVSEQEAKQTVDTSKTGNISKQKREDLLAKIKEIRTFISAAPQDENTGNLLSYLSDLEKDVNGKKYGLVFEEHREEIDEVLDTHTPVLTEDEELFINNGGKMNFLIEGDNLASLKLLQKTHRNSIDLIYIDPPYNTGNKDFIYDDCYIDTEDGFRHSKWISFMSKRLEIARSLLTEKGVIFIQISDIELSQLRLMCDSVFGEENFLNVISVNMKNIAGASGGGEDKRLKKNCEYILIYAKQYDMMPVFKGAYVYTEMSELIQKYIADGVSWKYTSVLIDEGSKEYVGSTVDGDGNEIKVYLRKNPVIKSIKQVAKDDNISEKDAYKKYGIKVFQTTNAQSSIRTRVMEYRKEKDILDDLISIEYIPKTGKNKGKIYEQFYKGDKCRLFVWLRDTSEIIDGELYKKDLQGTYWDFNGAMKNLTKEGNVEFGNGKKPIDLLKRIISLYPNSNISVLDFFAGSGSTGHAVIAQNLEDDGNRQFILCTNNQNDICREKTYKRLSNVINGYTNENGKFFGAMPASLKYYKVEYIPVSERMYYEYADELLCHIRELVELENGVNFTNNAEIAIVLTDEELEDFIVNIEDFSKCKKLYMGHDLLPSEEQEEAISSHEIEVNIIPDYYYRDLQEG